MKIIVSLMLVLGLQISAHAEEIAEAYFENKFEESIEQKGIISLSESSDVNICYDQVYEIAGSNPSKGHYKTLYVGKRNKNLPVNEYIIKLEDHIEDIRDLFTPYGLISYQVYATEDYEMAYQTWTSKEAATKAFSANEVKPVFEDAAKILTTVLFKEITN